jgi:hypothetical protein
MVLPTIGLVQHGEPMLGADRYTYLPAMLLGVPLTNHLLASALQWVTSARLPCDTRTGPGRPGAVKRPSRFPMYIGFLWRFCMGAQGA